jgi:hypothetical protein
LELFAPDPLSLIVGYQPWRLTIRRYWMDANLHTMSNLFAQLGLPADPAAIEEFISRHRPLGNEVALYRASFWTASQRSFLKEEIIEDADWAGVIDELNGRLR